MIRCNYCGFVIKEEIINYIKGKPYHNQCIEVMNWEIKKKGGLI